MLAVHETEVIPVEPVVTDPVAEVLPSDRELKEGDAVCSAGNGHLVAEGLTLDR